MKKLQQLLKKSEMKEYNVLAAYCIGSYFNSEKRKMDKDLLDTLLKSSKRCSQLFGYLFGRYTGHTAVEKLEPENFFPSRLSCACMKATPPG